MENKIETKPCPLCGKIAYHNRGISKKTNKPYENYKCGDKNCQYIEWIEIEPRVSVSLKEEPNWEAIRNEKRESINKLNALNNAVITANAWLQAGKIANHGEYIKTVSYFFEYYLSLNQEKNGKTNEENIPEVVEEV